MKTPTHWDLTSIVPASPESELCDRITRFFQEENERAQLTDIWKLANYHYNIGIYVVASTAHPSGAVVSHLVIAYGPRLFFEQRAEPLRELLNLDGNAVFASFLERVFDKVIEPTEEQLRAFVEHFPGAVEQWLAACMNGDFRGHPWRLSETDILKAAFEHFDDREQNLRAMRYVEHWWDRSADFPHPSWQQVRAPLQEAQRRLYAWWLTSPCVDYTFPPPPAVDHDRRRVCDFPYKGKTYRRVEAYGQVVVVPVPMTYFSSERPGFALVDLESQKEITVWLPTDPGGLTAARGLAGAISLLADLTQVPAFTWQQHHGLWVRLHELLLATREKYAALPPLADARRGRPMKKGHNA